MKTILALLLAAFSFPAFAQVAITADGTPADPSAMLDIKSSNKGLLLPRMTMAFRDAMINPATGLLIYQTDNTPGYYYNSGTTGTPAWVRLTSDNNPWMHAGSDIYFNTGKVGIGKIPGADSRQFQVLTGTNQAIAGVNNSTLGTIFAQNNGTGPAGDFRGKLLIVDGTQGAGKVLTSDPSGYTSWQTPVVFTDASFTGAGTVGNPLALSSFGASAGQVLKWTGTAWHNAADEDGPWSETTNYIYNSGSKRFGVGINVPSQKMTIAEGGTSCYMNFQNGSTGFTSSDGLTLGLSGLDGILTNEESGRLFFGTSNSVKMTIAADGDVGIGTAAPLYKLDITGALNLNRGINSGIALYANADEAIWYNGTYFSWGYGGTYNYFGDEVTIGTSAVPGYNLVVNGSAAKTGGGSWTVLSDERSKDLTGAYEKGLNDILQLEPVRFTYKSGNSRKLNSTEEQIGFVAQEVQRVFPEAVTMAKDGYLDFNMHALNVALVNAIKELKAENDLLKARLEKLEKQQHKK